MSCVPVPFRRNADTPISEIVVSINRSLTVFENNRLLLTIQILSPIGWGREIYHISQIRSYKFLSFIVDFKHEERVIFQNTKVSSLLTCKFLIGLFFFLGIYCLKTLAECREQWNSSTSFFTRTQLMKLFWTRTSTVLLILSTKFFLSEIDGHYANTIFFVSCIYVDG